MGLYHKIESILDMRDEQMNEHLIHLLVKYIDEEKKSELYMGLHIVKCGYHFDEYYLGEALSCIGGEKESVMSIRNNMNMYGISYPNSVTDFDISYVYHMFLSDYGDISISKDVLCRLVHAYITDADYPVVNGKAFAEWRHKIWLRDNKI